MKRRKRLSGKSTRLAWPIEARRASEESASSSRWRTFVACESGFNVDLRPRTFRIAPKRHQGAALVIVLIGMAVATMIFLSVLKLIAVQRQSVELQTRQIQAGWLAESAIERAVARLSADANYRGETWNISAQDLGGRDGATIAIRVEDVPGKPDRRSVRVEADYPTDPNQRARQSREAIIADKAGSSNK